MANQVDALDEQILAALQANGRLTMKALAEQVGLSSPAMIERVRRLEERGVIAGYRAVIAPGSLGRPIPGGDYSPFLERVEAEPAIAECHRITGSAHYIVKAHLPDVGSLERLVDELSKAGAQCDTALVLSSPVPYRPITPPEGTTAPRARAARRRRRGSVAGAGMVEGANEPVKRPGRPRGRRPAGVETAG
jgi:Lrp/AsnC family transcriptional regulator, leucine-responsive regulatory protein